VSPPSSTVARRSPPAPGDRGRASYPTWNAGDLRAKPSSDPLVPLPAQPTGTAWPTDDWPEGDVPAGVELDGLLEAVCDDSGPLASTFAVVVVAGGRVVAERYQGRLEHLDRPAEDIGPATPLLSWSMAKSMLHAVVGTLVADGRLSITDAAAVAEWGVKDDPRRVITVDQLLLMRDGLAFVEDYVDDQISDVIQMLFGPGRPDMAHFAAHRPLAAVPGERFNYSSGTTNIISGIVARLLGPGEPYEAYLAERLFGPIAMSSARPGFDDAGTWTASSYVHATARDFARFGLLYLRDGVWDGQRVLPEGWVDYGRQPRSVDPSDGSLYGAHWWVVGDEHGTFRCAGYNGQSITVCPALDLVVVRLGSTPAEHYPDLIAWRAAMVDAFAGPRRASPQAPS